MQSSDSPDRTSDGIDGDAWSRLLTIVRAACTADARGYVAEIQAWSTSFPLAGQHRLSIYLKYLLSYRIRELLRQNKPTDDDLQQTAAALYPGVRRILGRASLDQVDQTIHIAFDEPTAAPAISAAEFTVCAGALLGVMADDPDSELGAIRPRLAAWWNRHYDSFRAQGLRDYDSQH